MKMGELFEVKKKRFDRFVQMKTLSEKEEPYVCPVCRTVIKHENLEKNLYCCPNCSQHFKMPPKTRIQMLADKGWFKEVLEELTTKDPIKFPGYMEKIDKLKESSGSQESVVAGIMKIGGIKTAVAVMNGDFLMGSMGTVAGEKITALTEYAGKKGYPLVIFSASGGARMQEGLFSMMQMAKTAAAIEKYKENGGLFISVLTDPTTGGVSASFASLGDIIIAEPKALICFAGPRVIEQTIGRTLPEGFQKAEFLLENGMIDLICTRRELKSTLSKILKLHKQDEAFSKQGEINE